MQDAVRLLAVGRGLQRPEAPLLHRARQFVHLRLERRIDPFDGDELIVPGGLDQRLADQHGRRAGDVRHRLQPLRLGVDVVEALRRQLRDIDVRRRAEDAIAQLALEAGHQRDRDDQRRDAHRHAERRDHRDQRNERLLAPGHQIPKRDVHLEAHIYFDSGSGPVAVAVAVAGGSGLLRVRGRGRCGGLAPRTHQREQDDITDRRAVGQHHHQPIDPDALSARRRQPVFQRADVVLVHRVRFLIALRALGELRLEAAALLHRIGQLAERIRQLEAADIQLEALHRIRIVLALLRQRRDLGREVVDERRLDQRVLPEVLEDIRRDAPRPRVLHHRHAELRGQRRRGLRAPQLHRAHVDAQLLGRRLRRRLAHRQPPVRRLQRNRVPAELHLRRPDRLLRDVAEQLLRQAHQLLILRVRLIELQHRELGIVLRRNPFVPEVPVDLVDALHAADRQPLEIQLRRDAHVERHVERVVMRRERTRQRAAGDRLHHRRLDFEEPALVEERPQRLQHAAPHLEHAARIRVDDQIQIPLPIPRLDVLQPMPLLRQRHEAFRQEGQ